MASSDHVPILVDLDSSAPFIPHGFRFQAAWLTHQNFKNKVQALWKWETPFLENIIVIAEGLSRWNFVEFGNIFHRKRKLRARLVGIQKTKMECISHNLLKLERKLQAELETVLRQEELLWFQ